MTAGLRIETRGTIQGVGFRPWVYRVAHELGSQGGCRVPRGGQPTIALRELDPAQRLCSAPASQLDPDPAAAARCAIEMPCAAPYGIRSGSTFVPVRIGTSDRTTAGAGSRGPLRANRGRLRRP